MVLIAKPGLVNSSAHFTQGITRGQWRVCGFVLRKSQQQPDGDADDGEAVCKKLFVTTCYTTIHNDCTRHYVIRACIHEGKTCFSVYTDNSTLGFIIHHHLFIGGTHLLLTWAW